MTDDNVQEYVAYWFTPQPKEFLGEAIRHLVPQKGLLCKCLCRSFINCSSTFTCEHPPI